MSIELDDLDGMLAVYALDAVDDEERAAIEAVLATDPAARAEVEAYASAMATLDVGKPRPEVLEAILARVEPRERRGVVVPLAAPPRAARAATWRVVAVAAAVALGVVAFRSAGDGRGFDADFASATTAALRAAAAQSGEPLQRLGADGSRVEVTVAVVSDTEVLLVADPSDADSPLRVWAITPDGPVELAPVGELGRLTLVRLPRGTTRLVLAESAQRADEVLAALEDAGDPATTGTPTLPTPTAGTPSAPVVDAPPGPVIALPPLTLPPLTLPPVDLPLPTVTVPSLPGLTVPSLPGLSLPGL
jgi:anti-sigma-K factor RskA